ncbi:BZ3500_MvSof-1268-A1-R1_Chr10-2g02857 [Microbotryum saponariae]|uniref:BZ3500_MvSof-1268-A1-R1_Chr10-2g02857 protein n=1 Tax=Microbotryum saponariae TaxID=289078 RepID=A0A2X0M200_9BASI|nr:BZ3501_MvSof-1269-A2-R1_Chr10-2g02443 [Microbotryum saponariae]SDA01627.1 BZ3500_MvSof-1268-A1-R1_Chr10-2g02857 [Microbotryum saponariae]
MVGTFEESLLLVLRQTTCRIQNRFLPGSHFLRVSSLLMACALALTNASSSPQKNPRPLSVCVVPHINSTELTAPPDPSSELMSPASAKKWDQSWMPSVHASKTEPATERIFDAEELYNKKVYIRTPSIDFNEARLVAEGDQSGGWKLHCSSSWRSVPSAPIAVLMIAEELEKHLNRDDFKPAETHDVDQRRECNLFVYSDGNRNIRPAVKYVKELPPSPTHLELKDLEGLFPAKTGTIESWVTECKGLRGQGAFEASIGRLDLEVSDGQVARQAQEVNEGSRGNLRMANKKPFASLRCSIDPSPGPTLPLAEHSPLVASPTVRLRLFDTAPTLAASSERRADKSAASTSRVASQPSPQTPLNSSSQWAPSRLGPVSSINRSTTNPLRPGLGSDEARGKVAKATVVGARRRASRVERALIR